MRLTLPLVINLGLGLAPALALAQQTPTPMLGSCSGSVGNTMIGGTVGLVLNGKTIPTTEVFGLAECECPNDDIKLQIQMGGAAGNVVPNTATQRGTAMYIGLQECSDPRNNPNQLCEQISSVPIAFESFTTPNPFSISVPVPTLVDPRRVGDSTARTCAAMAGSGRVITLLLGDTASMPAKCTLNQSVDTVPPPRPSGVQLRPGDGALTVSWNAPPVAEASQIRFYQVLCRLSDVAAGADDTVPSFRNTEKHPQYAACINGKIQHREFPAGGVVVNQPTDMATSTLLPPEPGDTNGTNEVLDAGTQDGGAADQGAPADMIDVKDLAPPADLAAPTSGTFLDQKYLCSGNIMSSAGSIRIDGLENDKRYDIVVLAIDFYGNAASSTVVTGSPVPAQNLAEALWGAGNRAGGFACSAVPPGAQPTTLAGAALFAALGALGVASVRTRRRRGPAQGTAKAKNR